jgi:hypothetical protein
MLFVLRLLITILLCSGAPNRFADDNEAIYALEKDILTARLQGNYPQALLLCAQLKAIPAGEALGIALELDTQLTALSWDARKSVKTEDMVNQTDRLIRGCDQKRSKLTADQFFLCGRGHFARAYLSAMDGKFYAAGTHAARPNPHRREATLGHGLFLRGPPPGIREIRSAGALVYSQG